MPKGYLDGQTYPATKRVQLAEYLRKRDVDILITNGNPAFQAFNPATGRSALYLPLEPTVLQIKHELSHWLDCRNMGVEKYSRLNRLEKEQMVLDRLRKNRMWDDLNAAEKKFSETYVDHLKSSFNNQPRHGIINAK